MRKMMIVFILVAVLGGCQTNSNNTMNLLDEKVMEVNISESQRIGEVNQDILFSIQDQEAIKLIENAIRTAIKKQIKVETKPDYDIQVEYDEGLPIHAIHIWLGDEDEQSILMYMVGEGETYVTTPKVTNELRKLLLP